MGGAVLLLVMGEEWNCRRGTADMRLLVWCRRMPGPEMQNRLDLIEMKLDAIMAYLGIKNPHPLSGAPRGGSSIL